MDKILERFPSLFRRNRYLRFTPSGMRFVLTTLAVGLAAVNTRNNLLYLILAMLLSFIVLSGILSEKTLRYLKVERMFPSHPFAGIPFLIYLQVTSRRRGFPSFCISIHELEHPGIESKPVRIYRLPSAQSLLFSTQILFRHRGLFRLEGIRYETTFPFGFFRKSLIRRDPQEVIVYPEISKLPQELLMRLTGPGESHESQLVGPGSSIRSLRDYTPLDDARSIHWKASARQGRLLSKEYEHEEERQIVLRLINHLPESESEEDRDLLEKSISMAASISHHWLMQGYAIEIQTLNQHIPMGRGILHLNQILKMLALLEPVSGFSGWDRSIGDTADLSSPSLLLLPRHESLPENMAGLPGRRVAMTDSVIQSWWTTRELLQGNVTI